MMERRWLDRKDASVPGWITFGPNRTAVFCLVRNLSRLGAKLEIEEVIPLPDTFSLTMEGEHKTYRAQTSWRQDFEIGIQFHGTE